MEISRPDGLGDIAKLGLTLSEAKQLLANVQREIAAAQARDHVVRRPDCPRCDGVCHVKDYHDPVVATLFGQVAMKLPRFRCASCGGIETGISWPSHCRSTPELDRLRAHLSALMTYRVAADLLEQMFPIDAGTDPETLRRRTLRVGEAFADRAVIRPETSAPAITVTLDSTFIRSCEDGERHLEVRVGNVETKSGARQVFGAVAKTDTDIKVLIRRSLDGSGAKLGVRRQQRLAGMSRWLDGISVRIRHRPYHYKPRTEPEAAGRRRVVTSAFADFCPSGGSPRNWLSLL